MSAAGVPAGIAATAPSLKKLVAVNGELESVNILSTRGGVSEEDILPAVAVMSAVPLLDTVALTNVFEAAAKSCALLNVNCIPEAAPVKGVVVNSSPSVALPKIFRVNPGPLIEFEPNISFSNDGPVIVHLLVEALNFAVSVPFGSFSISLITISAETEDRLALPELTVIPEVTKIFSPCLPSRVRPCLCCSFIVSEIRTARLSISLFVSPISAYESTTPASMPPETWLVGVLDVPAPIKT